MIQASELRIGNWISLHGNIIDVDGIAMGCVNPVWATGEIFHDGDITEAQPIPLDESWLIRSGFEFFDYEPNDELSDNPDFIYLSYKIQLEGKRYYYSITNTEFSDWQFCVKTEWAEEMLIASCKFVHQLQNLFFALTGAELTFKD